MISLTNHNKGDNQCLLSIVLIVVFFIFYFRAMASSAYRARRDSLPPLPANLAALQIQGRWAQTTQHQAFLLFDEQNGNDRIICFCSEEDLQQMCDSDVLYMDGTFSTAPRMFAQLYTIHGFLQGKQMPLAYALLTGKFHHTIHV